MAQIKSSKAIGKFLVFRNNSEILVEKISGESEAVHRIEDILKSKAYKICNNYKEAIMYSRICENIIDKMKGEAEYQQLYEIKTKALLDFNQYKKDRIDNIIKNSIETNPSTSYEISSK